MSRKSLGFRTPSRRARKENKIQSLFESKEKRVEETYGSRRSYLILGLMILLIFTVGALASWRGFSNNLSGAPNSSSNAALLPVPTPPGLPADAPSKEFVYAGSALLATTEPFREPPADLAVWRPSSGTWYVMNSLGQWFGYQFGLGTDIPAPGDFDGDGKTDFCVFRPSNGTWYIVRSSDDYFYGYSFGAAGDVPAIADYDGDGKADIAVFRPSDLKWYIVPSSGSTYTTTAFGASGDVPVSADFDGDGRADIAVWRDSNATFYVWKSTDNQITGYSIGQSGDVPTPGDYDGDGKADYAAWRRGGDNIWRIFYSSTGTLDTGNIVWGQSNDVQVQGDYDHDWKTDIAVWRPANGVWYIRQSGGGTRQDQWGQSGDIPVPAPYRR